jgi:hypothetical protein
MSSKACPRKIITDTGIGKNSRYRLMDISQKVIRKGKPTIFLFLLLKHTLLKFSGEMLCVNSHIALVVMLKLDQNESVRMRNE